MARDDSTFRVIGQPLERVEDERHLRGRACFVADIPAVRCHEVAFVRSPVPHGRLTGLTLPPQLDASRVWDAKRIANLVRPIEARLLRKEFNGAPLPPLAVDRVRFAGEAIAAVAAPTRAEAEDAAEEIFADIEPLPAVMNAWNEVENPGPVLHDNLQSNIVMRFGRTIGDEAAFAGRSLTRRFSMARVLASPLEGRGCLCRIDPASGELVVHISHQRPHLLRSFLAEHLVGIAESDIRVVVPDVGGGFGAKSNFYPEELVVAAMTLATGEAHRWTEDRYEHFVAANHSREHDHEITAWFGDDGRIHALHAKVVVDSGAYSSRTSTGAIEANMATNVMLGPYDIRNYRFEAISVYTNKTPVGPFRGVGRPAGCFAMERIVDEIAHELGMAPMDVRAANLIAPEQFPYTTATGLYYDSGNYAQALRAAQDHVRTEWKPRPSAGDARFVRGIGYATYVEQAAHGSVEWHRRGSTLVYGHEAARATMAPDGTLTFDVGTLNHGQGHFTTYAQIASELTGVPVASVRVRQGDTGRSPYGMGTVASRSIVMGGGAVAAASRMLVAKAREIAASILECPAADLVQQGPALAAPDGRTLSLQEIARLSLVELHRLPKHVPPGMSVEGLYRPEVETGTFSYGVHAAEVEVDTDTGVVRVLRYLVVEDCGTVVNPLVLDGQIRGGVAQGIGQALYEELRYTEDGQPVSVTFGDYALPSAVEIPRIDIVHQCTPSPFSEFGMKGMGEGGCVAPPAAIANAVRIALKDRGIHVNATPIRPDDLLAKLMEATS
ncbi:xanthine dehydrogenase family protein molybdopterin-binding subunit [Ramlibacter sp.]|uniref:xanthine dehydrogenase family protein molybdopterin-binding subunit n=1 Tax=Ramlibacter sp. TaxID=1917967 RepID=UPI003D0AD384